jgi:REP element-mobilizing transposase RayT
MPQSHARVWLHVVFSTKNRQAFLKDDDLREEMCKMLGHHVNETGCQVVRVGGWHDHVHILLGFSRTITIAKLIEVIKGETSEWAKKRAPEWARFYWQNGYGVFSVSQSLVEQVIAYIENQGEHHARMTFQDEFRILCEKHEIEIDERYVWD